MNTKETKLIGFRKKPTCFVAFPGIGKTTYARQHGETVDLDFGYYRASLGVDPKHNSYIVPQFCRLAGLYIKEGFTVLTNEPECIPFLKQMTNVVVVLPKNVPELVERVRLREQNNPVNKAFVTNLQANAEQWVRDWLQVAKQYGVKAMKVTFFEEAANGKKED